MCVCVEEGLAGTRLFGGAGGVETLLTALYLVALSLSVRSLFYRRTAVARGISTDCSRVESE